MACKEGNAGYQEFTHLPAWRMLISCWLLCHACPSRALCPPPLPPAAQVPEDLLSTEFKKGLGLPVDGDAFDAAEDEQGSGPRRGSGMAAPGGQAWAGGRVGFTPEHLRELLKRRDITFTKSAFE